MTFVFTLLGVTRPPSPPHNQLLDSITHINLTGVEE